jgi:chromosomal replication initiator protein
VSDVVRAYKHKAFDDFKRYYRSLDLLLIDDIQFSATRAALGGVLLPLQYADRAHKQVVITCDTY